MKSLEQKAKELLAKKEHWLNDLQCLINDCAPASKVTASYKLYKDAQLELKEFDKIKEYLTNE